ncbi:MAG: glycosyl hydrolase family 65 protein, partial [Enterococcus aquimarinus]
KYAFHINYRNRQLHINIDKEWVTITLKSGDALALTIYGEEHELTDTVQIALKK